jgi:hypothetical protein
VLSYRILTLQDKREASLAYNATAPPAERGKTVDLTDPATLAELETHVPAIQQGKGAKQLL